MTVDVLLREIKNMIIRGQLSRNAEVIFVDVDEGYHIVNQIEQSPLRSYNTLELSA